MVAKETYKLIKASTLVYAGEIVLFLRQEPWLVKVGTLFLLAATLLVVFIRVYTLFRPFYDDRAPLVKLLLIRATKVLGIQIIGLSVAMCIIALVTAAVLPVQVGDSIFAGQVTAFSAPIMRRGMK